MKALKWKKDEFRVARRVLTRRVFDEWIAKEGHSVLVETKMRLPARWFFGRKRAKRHLYRKAKTALHPKGRFAAQLKKRLDQLPSVIRSIGILIKKKGHKDLYSVDAAKLLVVVPRGLVQHDFKRFLIEELGEAKELGTLWGLSKYVLGGVAIEAEQLFFRQFKKKGQCFDAGNNAVLLGADPHFRWKINRANGHYYCGYAGKEEKDLSKKKDFKKFKSEMDEVLFGQIEYLKRLKASDVSVIAGSFAKGGSPRRQVTMPADAQPVVSLVR